MTSQRESAVVPGIATRLASAVLRVTAPNASLLTGPGTNSYLVGERDCAVLDPGPDIEKHVDALIASAPGPVRWIVLTHTHPDHSPAATRLKRATGASIVGTVAPQDGRQDYATRLDRIVRDGESVGAAGHELLAIATPGHASNHICYLHAASGLLFSGDHILNGSTTVILAPDGDMAQYLASLERLRHVGMSGIAPGHGAVLTRSEERRVGKECRSLCDWSSDVCSSDLDSRAGRRHGAVPGFARTPATRRHERHRAGTRRRPD